MSHARAYVGKLPVDGATLKEAWARHGTIEERDALVRQMWATGEYTGQDLAREFGLTPARISQIVNETS